MKGKYRLPLVINLILGLFALIACSPNAPDGSTVPASTTTAVSMTASTTTAATQPTSDVPQAYELGERVTGQGLSFTVDSVVGTNAYRPSAEEPIVHPINGVFLFIDLTVINETKAPLEINERFGLQETTDSESVAYLLFSDITESSDSGKNQRVYPDDQYGGSLILEPGGERKIRAKGQIEGSEFPVRFELLATDLRPAAVIPITPEPMDRYLTGDEVLSLVTIEYPGREIQLRGIFGDKYHDFQPFYAMDLRSSEADPTYLLVDARTGEFRPGELGDVGVFPPNYGMGSSNDNIANLGYAVGSDDWIFYRNNADQSSLCRIKSDGSGSVKLSDHRPIFLNAIGDWIYYMEEGEPGEEGVWRIRTDGWDQSLVTAAPAYYLRAADYWLYYINITGQPEDPATNRLFRMKPDGSGQQQITQRTTWFFSVEGERIYYLDVESGLIRRIFADGSGDETVSEQPVRGFAIKNQRIYYLPGPGPEPGIWRMEPDGTKPQKLSEDFTQGLNLADGWIYYARTDPGDAGSRQLKRMKLNGGEPQVLSEDDYVMEISVVGDWIHYSGPNRDRIRKATLLHLDGTNRIDLFPKGY